MTAPGSTPTRQPPPHFSDDRLQLRVRTTPELQQPPSHRRRLRRLPLSRPVACSILSGCAARRPSPRSTIFPAPPSCSLTRPTSHRRRPRWSSAGASWSG